MNICAGSFETCEICNNLDSLSRRKMSKSNHDAVHAYRRVHLRMQASERLLLERNIQKALTLLDDNGQPLQAVILSDGMTERKGTFDCIIWHEFKFWLYTVALLLLIRRYSLVGQSS